MVWGRICPDGHSTYPCESEELNATQKMLSAARGSGALQQMVVVYRPKKAACLQHPSLPETSRNSRLEDAFPIYLRVLYMQGADKTRGAQRNVWRLQIP